METRALVHRIDSRDNVAVALADLSAGVVVSCAGREIVLVEGIPFGHKLAIRAIRRSESVVKYGDQIGLASRDISPGEHVHVHNVESTRGRGDLAEGLGQPRRAWMSHAMNLDTEAR